MRAEKLRRASLEYLAAPDLGRLRPSPLGTHEGLARLRGQLGPSGSQADPGSSQASSFGLQVADRGSVSGGGSRWGSSGGTSAAASSQGAAMSTSTAGLKRQWDRRSSEEGVSAMQLQCHCVQCLETACLVQAFSFSPAPLQEWKPQAAGDGTSSSQLHLVQDWRHPVAAPGSSKSHEAELLKEMCGQTWIDKEDLSDWQSLGEGAFATVQKANLTLDSGAQVSLAADVRGYGEGQELLCTHCWVGLSPPTGAQAHHRLNIWVSTPACPFSCGGERVRLCKQLSPGRAMRPAPKFPCISSGCMQHAALLSRCQQLVAGILQVPAHAHTKVSDCLFMAEMVRSCRCLWQSRS